MKKQPRKAKKKPDPPPARDPKTLDVGKLPDETESDAIARTVLRPSVTAAYVIKNYMAAGSKKTELMGLIKDLVEQAKTVIGGDMQRVESMLVCQAHTLDSIFGTLASHASVNMREGYLNAFEQYMRLALKAQGQCRATLETLAMIKNPPIVYTRQANFANGPQQVNNGVPSHARENETQQTKLSGDGNELLSNTGTPAIAGGINPALEAVGEVHRAENKNG